MNIAKAKGRLRGEKPKLIPKQEAHLVGLRRAGEHTTSELAGLFGIEAIFCCQFLALLLGALIERQIRTAMRDAATRDIPLYPELRACEAPPPNGSSPSSPT